MKKYINVLKKTQLFRGVSEDDILSMLTCLDARIGEYKRADYVFRVGDSIDYIAVLLDGGVHIQKDDYWGNRTIVNRIYAGEMFGEAYIAPDSGVLLNDAVAAEDSTVIFFDVKRIMRSCSASCRFHTAVVENLFFAISEKNRNLVQKLGHISKRSTREKLISYLSEEARRNNNASFRIPFNRQQLADFLSVDRSAMSAELCKMRDEGLLEFHKNEFHLL